MLSSSPSKLQAKEKRRYGNLIQKTAEEILAADVLTKDRVDKLLRSKKEFQKRFRRLIEKLSAPDPLGAEVTSNLGYISGYKPQSIGEQIEILRGFFPQLNYSYAEKFNQPLPSEAEGWFVIPKWKSIARNYPQALQEIIRILPSTHERLFVNILSNKLTRRHLRTAARTKNYLCKISVLQNIPDLLIIPAQFGLKHRGRSVVRVQQELAKNEFGLDTFSVATMLLTHPDRIRSYDDLWIYCIGDVFFPRKTSKFGHAPVFSLVRVGCFELQTKDMFEAQEHYGAVTGFLP